MYGIYHVFEDKRQAKVLQYDATVSDQRKCNLAEKQQKKHLPYFGD